MKKRAFLYIILAGIFWGTSGIYVHFLSPCGYSSLQLTNVRGIVSAICMCVYALIHNKKIFKATLKELILYALSGVSMLLTATCYFASIKMTSVSTAVILMYTAPIFVMVYSVTFLGEKLTKIKALSVICMLIGCCLTSGVIGGFKFNLIGIVLGFISGISYAAYNIFTKIQMRRSCNPVKASMYCFIFMAVISFFISQPIQTLHIAYENPLSVPLLIGCGICTCILPYFLYTLALKVLPAGEASA